MTVVGTSTSWKVNDVLSPNVPPVPPRQAQYRSGSLVASISSSSPDATTIRDDTRWSHVRLKRSAVSLPDHRRRASSRQARRAEIDAPPHAVARNKPGTSWARNVNSLRARLGGVEQFLGRTRLPHHSGDAYSSSKSNGTSMRLAGDAPNSWRCVAAPNAA